MSNQDETCFHLGVVGIVVHASQRIHEDSRGLFEANAMIPRVERCLTLIPRELQVTKPGRVTGAV